MSHDSAHIRRLRCTARNRPEFTHLTLSGVIDENNKLRDLSHHINTQRLVINLAEVERINSCGVRDWLCWLRDIHDYNISVVLTACSPAMVRQLNTTFNFSGHAVVASFYAPYYCSRCDIDTQQLFDRDDMGWPPFEAPITRCDQCDMLMEFDDMPSAFFAFLERQPMLSEHDWYSEQAILEAAEESTVVQRDRPTANS